MAVQVASLVAVIILYILIMVIGVVAAKKTNKKQDKEEVMVANRSLGLTIACFTLTATMVGGGFINGSAESAAWYGLLHTQAPVCYCGGMLLSGIVFGPRMRRECYVTMFDPFQLKYGRKMGALLIIPHIFGDLFWSASILAALGGTLAIIVDISADLAIVISAAVAIFYTVLGGLFAVAYTDVLQLFFIVIGLVLACPFVMASDNVHIDRLNSTWVGEVPAGTEPIYFDLLCLLFFGGTTWQPFYQRILACKTPKIAAIGTVTGAIFSVLLAIPAMVLGVAGAAADWNSTSYEGPLPIPDDQKSYILPMVLHYLCPLPVGIVGISGIAAAVMSSADSVFLSSATMMTKNVYHNIIRKNASERELLWVLRGLVVVFGSLGTVIAITSNTIYGLFVLCGDLMYVVLFPQLCCVLYLSWANTYGSFVGFVVSFLLRLLSGDDTLGIPPAIKFPLFDEETQQQGFPFRTLSMLSGLFCIIGVSWVTHVIFTRELLDRKYDIARCHLQRTITNASTRLNMTSDYTREKKGKKAHDNNEELVPFQHNRNDHRRSEKM